MIQINYLRFMINVSVFGYGNVGFHLVNAFENSKAVNLIQIYTRHTIKNKSFKAIQIHNLNDLAKADIYIIAIPDDTIKSFSSKLNLDGLVVHTSGSADINTLTGNFNKGVFYPLQSFSKTKTVNFKKIPIVIEAQNPSDLSLLHNLANCLSPLVHEIDSKQRQHLHIAAVFVNNFTNYMYHIGESLCIENNIDFNILKPLIRETAKKIKSLSPTDAQTGPAKRNDQKTIANHLKLLPSEYKEIYTLLTKSIQQHDKEL